MIELDARVSRGAFFGHYRGRFGPPAVVTGPSGSGKTTLLDLLAGLVDATGSCSVDGASVLDSAAGVRLPARRRGVGYAFQDDRLFPHLTVKKNLGFAGRGDVRAVAEALDLSRLLDRRPGDLSGGEKKRVAVGRALLAAERLLLLDEPFAPLDDRLVARVARLIEDKARHTPTILVSHAPERVAFECVPIDRLVDPDLRGARAEADPGR